MVVAKAAVFLLHLRTNGRSYTLLLNFLILHFSAILFRQQLMLGIRRNHE